MTRRPPRVLEYTINPTAVAVSTTLSQRLFSLIGQSSAQTVIGWYDSKSRSFVRTSRNAFLEQAVGEAVALRERGLQDGQPVLIACAKPHEAATAYLATAVAGGLPMIAPYRPGLDGAARSLERLGELRAGLGPDCLLLVRPGGSSALGGPEHCLELTGVTSVVGAPVNGVGEQGCTAHLQATSGSTSAPRPVAVTQESLLSNIAAIVADLHVVESDVMVNWLPLYHDLGLVFGFLTGLLAGASVYLISPFQFLRDPACWLEALSSLQGTLTASPTSGLAHAVRRLKNGPPAGLSLGALRHLVCGGEPVDASTLRAFTSLLEPCGLSRAALAPSYGLAEATVYVSSWSQPSPPLSLRITPSSMTRLDEIEVVHAGSVFDGEPVDAERCTEVVAVGRTDSVPFGLIDSSGAPVLRDDRCGEIVVAGPSVTAGYRRPDGTTDGFDRAGLRTGDVGFLHDGLLYVVERFKNVIIRRGENYGPLALEEALAARLDVAAHNIVVIDSDLRPGQGRVIAVVETSDATIDAAVAQRALANMDTFELPIEELLVVRAGALPRTTSGKKQHHATRQQLQAGELKVTERFATQRMVPVPPTIDLRDEQCDGVIAIIDHHAREHGSTNPVVPAAHLSHDLMFDSMSLYDLVVDIEDALAVALPDHALRGVETVADLLRVVRLAGSGALSGDGVGAAADRLRKELPGLNLTVQRQDGRMLEIGDRWFADFASCNYLGLDIHPEVEACIAPLVAKWGTHPSWTRAIASPQPYAALEQELADTVGVGDTVVFPAVTLLHLGVLPRLVGRQGLLLVDSAAHHSIQEAAVLVRGNGGTVQTVRHGDLGQLESQLASSERFARRVIAVDGVFSMSGAAVDLPRLQELAVRYDAVVYVDDAHGFGILGEQPTPEAPYGHGGSGVVRWHGLSYDRVIYVAGLSKAYSSMGAFITCTGGVDRALCQSASTLVFSGPVPVASLATALEGLRLNRTEGDQWRNRLLAATRRLVDGLEDHGFAPQTPNLLPIVNVVLGAPPTVIRAARHLWDSGVLCTPSVFPATPLHAGGLRFTVTAANTDAQVDLAVDAMARARHAEGHAVRAA